MRDNRIPTMIITDREGRTAAVDRCRLCFYGEAIGRGARCPEPAETAEAAVCRAFVPLTGEALRDRLAACFLAEAPGGRVS